MSIVITGANGQLGSLIIQQLLQKVSPHEITACVRHLETGKHYEAQGITVRLGDYDQPDSLEQAFAGASQLLLISSSHPDDTIRIRQHTHIIEVAKKCKVEHILYTSFAFSEASSIPLSNLHLATEHAICTTGIPYTFLRNALYTDFVKTLDLNAAIAKGALDIYPGEWKFNTVTRWDLARGIAAVLSGPDRHKNKKYEFVSSSPWTFSDLTAALTELTGRSISLRHDPQIKNWIFGFLGKIDTRSTSDELEQLISGPLTSLKESIRPFIST
ncbi:NAD(P)H-binding protein [Paenibacillus sp. A3M_27_13]|uniref:NAD(P)H-binding protein n=1 Tax=Paenibacillus sp. A3M_27_13 TaxID=2962029 RepID=UPI0020B6A3BA|nr:NAD(P)H-binding protein [Paenibacillus sp. A3M_27_13]MCP3745470.1 NAD(P)H-binding protein [Paenibacillus sp. A3M_27_13]